MFEVIFYTNEWRKARTDRFGTLAEAMAAGWTWLTTETEGEFDVTNIEKLGHDGAWIGTFDKEGKI